jgi:hypothetical protein
MAARGLDLVAARRVFLLILPHSKCSFVQARKWLERRAEES